MVPEGHETEPPPSERRREGWPRWSVWMLVALVLASVVIPGLINRDSGTAIDYSDLIDEVSDGKINSIVLRTAPAPSKLRPSTTSPTAAKVP